MWGSAGIHMGHAEVLFIAATHLFRVRRPCIVFSDFGRKGEKEKEATSSTPSSSAILLVKK
jgi:hypothetical protein